MIFLLRASIYVFMISMISCTKQSEQTTLKPETTLRPQTTPKPQTTCTPKPQTITTPKPQTTTTPKPQTTTTPKPQTTTVPPHCPYFITDIDDVVSFFFTNKNETNVKVQSVLMIQQSLMRNATCTKTSKTCSPSSPSPTVRPTRSLLNILSVLRLLCKPQKVEEEPECLLPPPDVAAIAQFGRYFDGNQRAIEVMKLEAERIFHLLSLEDPDSECACEIKQRTITAVDNYGYGIISCTSDSVDDLNESLGKIQPSICVDLKLVEFFTNYKINNIYFTAESALRKCKTKYIDAFYAELAWINAELESCITKAICSQF